MAIARFKGPTAMPNMKSPGRSGTSIVVGFLLLLLVLAAAFLYAGWDSYDGDSERMTSAGYVVMTFGIFATLALGVGLMSLVYFSNRHGCDL